MTGVRLGNMETPLRPTSIKPGSADKALINTVFRCSSACMTLPQSRQSRTPGCLAKGMRAASAALTETSR